MNTPTRTLDRIDLSILTELQNDARLSNKELAHRVGLAPSSCHARVQRLIAEGVLLGFHAVISPAALGLGLEALVSIQLRSHGGGAIEEARDALLALGEVVELDHVGGSQDLVLRVLVRDTAHLRAVVLDGISARADIRHLETSIVFEHRTAWTIPDPN